MGGGINRTLQNDSRQMYDCQLVGQRFDTWPKREREKKGSLCEGKQKA